jgi:hypothetical protein
MIRVRNVILLLALLIMASTSAFAYPNFLDDYKADKMTTPKNKDVACNFCHMSQSGGDERNPFGKAFEGGGERFTPMLRAQFPDRFVYPMTKVDDNLTIHFSDPDNKVVIVETNGKRVEVNVGTKAVDGKPAANTGGDIAAAPAAASPTPSNFVSSPSAQSATDPMAREGAFFGQNVVNLPNGKPEKKGGWDFWIGHRFPEKVFSKASPGGLFGFDSAALVTFGVRVGVTDKLSVGVSRSNYFRTIELNTAYQVARQENGQPLTLQLRGSIEGRNNFVRRHDTIPWVGYGTSIQVVALRNLGDRVTVEAVPTFAFNTRNENSRFLKFHGDHNNTISLGLAMGVRVLKTTSLVAEVVPRLWGFRGERVNPTITDTPRPQIGFGVQKATYRHAFSLVFTTMQPATVSRYAVGTGANAPAGKDTFGIGFNIYRRLR